MLERHVALKAKDKCHHLRGTAVFLNYLQVLSTTLLEESSKQQQQLSWFLVVQIWEGRGRELQCFWELLRSEHMSTFGCKTPLLSSPTPLSLLIKAVGEMLRCWSRIVPWDQSEKVALKGVLQHPDSWAAHGYCRAPFLCSAGWPAAASGLLFPKWGYTYTSVSVQVLRQGRNCIWRRWSIFLALLSQLGSDGLHISSAPDISCGL